MKKKFSFSKFTVRLVLIVNTVFVVLPLLWSVLTSLKTSTEFYDNPWKMPSGFHIQNYINAIGKANMGDYFINSIFVTILGLILSLTFSIASAYVLSRYEFRFRNFIKKVYLIGLFLPPIFGLVPLFMLLKDIGLYDSLIGLSMVYAFTAIPYTTFILSSYFTSIPKEYEEAAIIDGCSYFGLLLKIMVPIARPAILTVSIFNIMAFWNEYMYSLTYISSEAKRTLPIGLINLMEVQRYSTDWGALFAGLVIVMLPTIIVYAILQKHITSGLTVGGLKG
ncbi:carbohydrate ABC transporter permease [Acidaminobacter sp. JC074]|uniref:carbohydrate ABC transporter permease n=1 Tax=Acidaminobacter sp. JC074 TaxID=2530199 RepID=UPI001F0DBBBD|nr:carbohydrate ABC transporter permease [Acidaminobacter sp. JC074]MCH4889393.1 carbohydrate ABC transporter permease [Acidaminobacter sp. JC074]